MPPFASEPPASRERKPGESDKEHTFWCRYWEVLRTKGVPVGREVWYERRCAQFIRELKPRRLKEATPADVTQFLGLLAPQPDSTGWKVKQADHALRILYQEVLRCPWAVQWPVGLPEMDGWMEGPEGGGRMPVPANATQARFAEAINKMIRALRYLHYAYRTEESYVDWAQRFLTFAHTQTREELDAGKVRAFLERLAVVSKVSASTQNQALNALVFFFREGLGKELGELGEFTPAKRPRRLPVVLTHNEAERLLKCLSGEHWLMAGLLYGSGLRLMECVRLRVKDSDLHPRPAKARLGSPQPARLRLREAIEAEGVSLNLRSRDLNRLADRRGPQYISLLLPCWILRTNPSASPV